MKGLRVLKRFKNMQRIAMSVVLLVVSVAVFAQYPPSPVSLEKSKQIDNSICELQYTLKFKKNYKQKAYNVDERIVQIGNHVIKDYSKIIFYFDSLTTENDRKGLDSPTNPNIVFCYELFNDLTQRTSFTKYRMALNGGTLC